MKNRFLQFLILSLICCSLSNAQDVYFHFDHLDSRRGLANNIVYDLAQDSKGKVWVATHGGLQQFDGTKFQSVDFLSKETGAKSVYKILIEKNEKTIWLITAGGISQYDVQSKQARKIAIAATISQPANVTSLFEDSTGTIWVCFGSDGFFFFEADSKTFQPYTKKWPKLDCIIQTVRPSVNSDEFWLTTSVGIIQYQNSKRIYRLLRKGELKNIVASFSKIGSTDHLLSSSSDQVWYKKNSADMDNAELISFELLQGQEKVDSFPAPDSNVTYAYRTRNGNLTALGNSAYVYNRPGRKWFDLFKTIPLKWNAPLCLLEDRDGLLWIGTRDGIHIWGLNEFKFNYFHAPNWKTSSLFTACVPIGDSVVLTLSESNGKSILHLVNQGLTLKPNILIDQINHYNLHLVSICKDNEGLIWAISDDNRILILSLEKQKFEIIDKRAAIQNKIFQITTDLDQNLWLISEKLELIKWLKGSNSFFRVHLCSDSLTERPHLLFDAEYNTIWLSYASTLLRYSIPKNECSVHRFNHGLHISEIKLWEKDSLLLGTNQGVFLLNKNQPDNLLKLKMSNGTFDEDVANLEIDRFRNIWIASPGIGICKITNPTRLARMYSSQDGAYFQQLDHSLSARLDDGRILMKTSDGFLIFSPQEVHFSSLNPRVNLTSFSLNNQLMNLDSIMKSKVSLKWWQNSIGFEFASPSYALKNSIQYSYQLEGADPSWLMAIGDSKIVYSNLRPGAYNFKVRANTFFQDALSDEVSFPFVIQAPFWDTLYFKLIILLVILLSVYLFYKSRVNRYIIEAKIRNRISRDLHDNIGSSLSSIGLMLKVVIGKSENTHANSLLNKIAYTAHVTQENLDDIVWNISSEKRTLSDIVDRMHEFIYGIFEGQPINLNFRVADELKNLIIKPERRYDLYLIFKELVNNAAKYAMANNITVELGLEGDKVRFYYNDDGIGFEPQKQTDGNGLSNIQTRARNLRGILEFNSVPGSGTNFLLKFPVK
jgi:ligand-binding sensor domain-containing protein/signal transduction histidine kinase